MTTGFYRAFEDRFRGPRELIKSRLAVYSAFVQPLCQHYQQQALQTSAPKALDLGCGRGEWLEFITEQGYQAQGVDLDDGMLQDCRERDLEVYTGDAIAHLQAQPDASIAVVSGFHLAEHIPFASLQTLAAEAMRVLQPGGLLILETPNPENLIVATCDFYLDPTHQRPIPPALLAFVAEYAGFAQVKILRLQEEQDIAERDDIGITELLNNASPDYAIVAQKAADSQLLQQTQSAFAKEYGLSLDSLAAKYDARLAAIKYQAAQALEQAQHALTAAEQTQIIAEQLSSQLQAVYASRSWRITVPLRWFSCQLRQLQQQGIKSRYNALVKKALYAGVSLLNRSPRIKGALMPLLRKTGLGKQLRARLNASHATADTATAAGPAYRAVSPEELTPHGREIHQQLNQLIDQQGDKH